MNKLITIDNLHRYNENIQTVIDFKVQKLMTDTELKFFCVEPVTVTIRGESTTYNSNTLVDIFLKTNDEFEIVPTSNKSIASLYAWPGALGTYYEWLEGVNLFDGVLFNMNNEDLYTKWSQGNQGLYHVQFAQYKNCIWHLLNDATTRNAVMIYTRPSMHVDATSNHKHDFCCTHYVHCFLNEHEDGYSLKYIVYQRSQDSVFGYNNDINWHKYVYDQMIVELTNKLKVPIYRECIECNVGSLHVYERHFNLLE